MTPQDIRGLISQPGVFPELKAEMERIFGENNEVPNEAVSQLLIALLQANSQLLAVQAAYVLALRPDPAAKTNLEFVMNAQDGKDSAVLPSIAALALAKLGHRSERVIELLMHRAAQQITSMIFPSRTS